MRSVRSYVLGCFAWRSRNLRLLANLTLRVFRKVSEHLLLGLLDDGFSDDNIGGGIGGSGAVGQSVSARNLGLPLGHGFPPYNLSSFLHF